MPKLPEVPQLQSVVVALLQCMYTMKKCICLIVAELRFPGAQLRRSPPLVAGPGQNVVRVDPRAGPCPDLVDGR